MIGLDLDERGFLVAADLAGPPVCVYGIPAARVKNAARRGKGRTGDIAFEHDAVKPDLRIGRRNGREQGLGVRV
jgi:hypothetical protein